MSELNKLNSTHQLGTRKDLSKCVRYLTSCVRNIVVLVVGEDSQGYKTIHYYH